MPEKSGLPLGSRGIAFAASACTVNRSGVSAATANNLSDRNHIGDISACSGRSHIGDISACSGRSHIGDIGARGDDSDHCPCPGFERASK